MNAQTPFHKILIANRGEVALRVMRSARALGYRCVAVYAGNDAGARHVAAADQAVPLGGDPPVAAYLNVAAIIAAAKLSGADAVHPGYGFLAENAHFAQACRDAALVFIGPSPQAIVAMGDKAQAKRLMQAAGVPCVPGYEGEDQAEASLAAAADRLGYPLLIKASAGGGGRGMRLVSDAAQFAAALHSARAEAQSAFGDARVILERAIVAPRHIEMQILADRYGEVIHLGERDCSVQRRHQKLIEEAPSPAVGDALRQRMGAAAVAAAKAIAYEGAGTLEFLLDGNGDYYFMEMNTRLQVEHAVTEAVTGLDLVELQLRLAAGEPLPLRQDEVVLRGHAMEVRLCAENAEQGFLPQSGTLALWQMPTTIRVDHGLASGAEISPDYDSMIAKLISHGASREEARRKLIGGLEDAVALGVGTNQAFLANCLRHPQFAAGAATTAFIEEHGAALLHHDAETEARAQALAAVLLYASGDHAQAGQQASRIAHRLPIPLRFAVDARPCVASLVYQGDGGYAVSDGQRQFALRLVDIERHRVRFECDGLVESAALLRRASELLLQYRGIAYRIEDRSRASTSSLRRDEGDGKMRAAMSGRIVALHAAVGEAVQAGQPVFTMEAMKMQHVHAAPSAGKLVAINAVMGEQVAAYRVVAEIAKDGET